MLQQLLSKEVFQWIKFLTDKKDNMAKIKVTQVKSKIGATARQKNTLAALGLKKLQQTVEHEATPQIEGMVQKVLHLVTVER